MALTTCSVRISYANIFNAKAMSEKDTPRFSVALMFDKKSKEQMESLKALHAEASAVYKEKWPSADKGPRIALTGHDKSPIKDGDKACNSQGIPLTETNAEYEGHFIIRAASTTRPVIVDRNMQEVLDTSLVYSGCFCKVNLGAYAYDTKGNKGVTFGLNGVQFWTEGERFGGGRPAVKDMFEAADGSDDPVAYENTDIPF